MNSHRQIQNILQLRIMITQLTPNNLNSNIKIETANIPHSLFALNRSTDQLLPKLNKFQRIANKFKTVYMMSH